ncbi:MAG TPA: LD-carboxypeptidase [Rubrivivax sp.]|nr:LD-carboxypeptidase [Rubrivivax sp.]
MAALALTGCAAPPRADGPAAVPATPPPPLAEPPAAPCAPPASPEPAPLLRPPRLRPGDVVGLFASASRMQESWIATALANARALGLQPRLAPNVRAVHGHYAGTVQQRVADLHALWADPQVRALWSIRGGAGSAQLLPYLDYDAMRADPKAVLGFSDVTALHLALQRRARLVSFHTLAGSSELTAFSAQALRAVLMEPSPGQPLPTSPEHLRRAAADTAYRARSVRGGSAEGVLVGGNLSVLSALVGTPFGVQSQGALLLLEDVGELPYRIDRMLTQLELAGLLRDAAALVGGIFRDCENPPGQGGMALAQVIDERFRAGGVPAVYGLGFGHVRDQLTLPLGVRARLDADARTLTLLDAAVQ